MGYIYHITTKSDWSDAQKTGSYTPKGYASEGFIHFSKQEQVAATAARYYSNIPELIVLKVEMGKLKAEIKTEQAPNGDWYPHLYGILNLDAVENVISLQAEPDGTYRFEGN